MTQTVAEAALAGDADVLTRLSRSLLVPERDNFVERPWGGNRILDYKRIGSDRALAAGTGFGEAFELAAFDADDEARTFPSVVECDDGSRLSLPRLLEAQGEAILGARFVGRHGACLPLLPKTLDVKELLSVQGHPPGHTEVYIIIDAEPGATIRLGFATDIDGAALTGELTTALEQQRRLLTLVDSDYDLNALHAWVSRWLADRDDDAVSIDPRLAECLASDADRNSALELLRELKRVYWHMLDATNAIAVREGQVIHNSTPTRLLGEAEPSAEVHALGNPERREVLALEIRRPGPTFRAWDNVRFPPRDVDVEAAIRALNLRATSAEDFVSAAPRADACFECSVDSPYFRIEHWRPGDASRVELPAAEPYCLHVLAGDVRASAHTGERACVLGRGCSALVPIGAGTLSLESTGPAHVVCVRLPED